MSSPHLPPVSQNAISLALVAATALALLVAALLFQDAGDRREEEPAPLAPPEFGFERADFGALSGWREDDQGAALDAFLVSCARIERQAPQDPANPKEALGARAGVETFAGRIEDWLPACAEARRVAAHAYADPHARAGAARAFFEEYFRPLRIIAVRAAQGEGASTEKRGLFTGYYEPAYRASRAPSEEHSAPVLARPDDLVMVDLGRFRPQLAGERIAGRVDGGDLVPYPDHRAINEGALGARGRPLAYVDPDDLLFMQIQGSGRLLFEDGSQMRVGYDGQNGHPYFAVGRALVESGAVAREAMSMQAIRAWLDAAPAEEARALRERNPSYVFFRPLTVENPELGPLGSEGVQLTPMRSLAVDRRYHAMGAPVWVDIEGENGKPFMRRLFIAQDTGGAIRGPVRGDVFFGAGAQAGEAAGVLDAEGEMFVLLPEAAAARLERAGA